MQYTVSGLIDDIIKDIGEDIGNSNYRILVLNWLQEAFDIICTQLDGHPFMNVVKTIETTANVVSYSLVDSNKIPGNLLSVSNKSNRKVLQYKDLQELKNSHLNLEQTGEPYIFYWFGFNTTENHPLLAFYPIPNATYQFEVSYKIDSLLLADNSSILPIPRNIVSCLRMYLRAHACKREGDNPGYQQEILLFTSTLESIKRNIHNKASNLRLGYSDIPSSSPYNLRRRNEFFGSINSEPLGIPGGGSTEFLDTSFKIKNAGDQTKRLAFNCASISTGITRTLVVPNHEGTLLTTLSSSGSFPTLNQNTTGTANSVSNSLTIGTGLTGSSYNGSSPITIAIDSTVVTLSGSQNLTNKSFNNTTTFETKDTLFTLQDDSDSTKKLQFQLSSISTSTTRTLTIPNANGIIDLQDNVATLTNKTINASNNTLSNITEAMLLTSDNTTLDVSITKHGFTPKAPNDNTKFLRGDATWAVPSGGGSGAISALTAAAANNTINNANYTQEWQWNSLAGASGLKISSTSTAAVSNLQILLEITLSGANSTSSQTTRALKISNTHTGTSSTNRALEIVCSGGSINDSIYSSSGDVTFIGGGNSVYFQSSTGHLIVRSGNVYSTNFYSDNDLGLQGNALTLRYSTTYAPNLKIINGVNLAGIVCHRPSVAKTSNYTLTAFEDSNVTHRNVGASGTVTETLPASPIIGERHRLVRVANHLFEFLANTGQTIRDAGNVSSSAGKLQLNNIGDVVEIEYVDTNVWYVVFKNVASLPTLT